MSEISDNSVGVSLPSGAERLLGFYGARGAPQQKGASQAAIGTATYAAPSAALGAATYAAPEAGAVNSGDAGTDTVIDSLRTQLIAMAADVAAHKTLVNSLRTQVVALAADVATHKTLTNELRSSLTAVNLIKGAA